MDHELLNDNVAHLLDGRFTFDPADDVDDLPLFDEEKYERFRYDRYDWTAAGFNPDYAVIRLGGGKPNRKLSPHSGVYFTVVSQHRYLELTSNGQTWYPLVEYERGKHGEKLDVIKRIGAHRRVGPRRNGTVLYMHRVITQATGRAVVDHKESNSLDNRDCALHVVTSTLNNLVLKRKRQVELNLMPGVEWRTNGGAQPKSGERLVRGVIMVNGSRIRSSEVWPLHQQEKAHAWYLLKRAEFMQTLAPQSTWRNWEGPVPPLVLPPPTKKFYSPSLPTGSIINEIPF